MKKFNISSMFLVPKNVYTSMLTRVQDNDIKEEIQLLNSQRDDGNYIEKAIDFNNQQERQKNQVFLKPNLGNETVTTNTNSNANANASVQTSNLNQSMANTDTSYTPSLNQTIRPVASTPLHGQAASRKKPMLPIPFEESLTEKDEEGYFNCVFCNEKFTEEGALPEHMLKKHNRDINKNEHLSAVNKTPENLTTTQNLEFYTPSDTVPSPFLNTGTKPKIVKTPVTSTPLPTTVSGRKRAHASKTSSNKKRNIKRKLRYPNDADDEDEFNDDEEDVDDNEEEFETTGLTKKQYVTRYGRGTHAYFEKKNERERKK